MMFLNSNTNREAEAKNAHLQDIEVLFKTSPPPKFFVGGLSHVTTDESLKAYFGRFGDLLLCEVLRDHYTLRSRGFGFIKFAQVEPARTVYAIRKQHIVDGKMVEIKFAVPKPQMRNNRRSNSEFDSSTSLASNTTYTNLNECFNPFPFERYPMSEGSKKVSPVSSVSSCSVYSNLNSYHHGIHGTGYAHSRSASHHTQSRKVFVGGLLYATGHESLKTYFENFGPVESAEVIYNKETKKSRGFGFVVFSYLDSVQECLRAQELYNLCVDGKHVEVKPSAEAFDLRPIGAEFEMGKRSMSYPQAGSRYQMDSLCRISEEGPEPFGTFERSLSFPLDLEYEDRKRRAAQYGNGHFDDGFYESFGLMSLRK